LENKNSTLESELAKALGQTKSLMDRLATMEADKDQLERELERVSLEMRECQL
jgi:ABC-type phosphate transport system auxiliary subunit